MTVVTNDRQRRAGGPAGSFASGAGGAILVGMTATLTSPTFVGRTEELARLAAAGDRAAGGVPDVGADRRRGRGRQDPAGRRGGGRRPGRRGDRPGRRLRGAGRRGRAVRPPGRGPARRSCATWTSPRWPGWSPAGPGRAGPPPARAGPAGRARRRGPCRLRRRPGPLVGAGAAVRAAAGAAGTPRRRAPGRCWWSRTCTGPTAPPATCSPSWSATCATAACCW